MYLKVEVIDEDNFVVYLALDKKVQFENEDDIKQFLKDIILKLKKKLKSYFCGYYELIIHISFNIIVLEFEKIDEYCTGVDLNIVVLFKSEIMFKYNDFMLIKPDYYYKKFFYKKINNCFDILKYLEFGSFIYGKDVEKIKMSALKIN